MQQTRLYQLIMIRITLLIFTLALLTSCEEEQDSQTALNATLDFDLYVSIETHAVENEDGSYLVQGITQNEILTMKIPSIEEGSYQFGGNSEELKLIHDQLGDFPLVGFFANGEISHNRLYGYTGVLTLFL